MKNELFNNDQRIVEGWYWALPSRDLKKKKVKAVTVCGKDMVVYRGEDGRVKAMHAYCPHMGAHLANGRVESNGLRCFFHNWKFAPDGAVTDIPALGHPIKACVPTYHCEEHYGLVWVFIGKGKPTKLPVVPELEDEEYIVAMGNTYVKECYPHVMMINAIDVHHFATVHNLPVNLNLEAESLSQQCIHFSNTTEIPKTKMWQRFCRRFYAGALTYKLSYWNGANGTVTTGPDFFHIHIVFASRPGSNGITEGQTVLITKKRHGISGWFMNKVSLLLSRIAASYFGKGDTEVFRTIKYDLKTPIAADKTIINFASHLEKQPSISIYEEVYQSVYKQKSKQQKVKDREVHYA